MSGGVTVRIVREDDVPALTALLTADRGHLAPWDPQRPDDHWTEASQRQDAARLLDLHRQDRAIPGVIVEDGRLVGQVTVADVVRGPLQSGTLGYWVAGHATGRGAATAAAAARVRIAFDEAGLHRLEAGTLPHDTASRRVLVRTGFRRFGYAPRYLRIAGEWRDHVLVQLLDEPGMR